MNSWKYIFDYPLLYLGTIYVYVATVWYEKKCFRSDLLVQVQLSYISSPFSEFGGAIRYLSEIACPIFFASYSSMIHTKWLIFRYNASQCVNVSSTQNYPLKTMEFGTSVTQLVRNRSFASTQKWLGANFIPRADIVIAFWGFKNLKIKNLIHIIIVYIFVWEFVDVLIDD